MFVFLRQSKGCQFHQQFTTSFLVQKCVAQLSSTYRLCFVIFWQEVSFSPTIYNQLLLWFPYSNKITNPNSKHIKARQNSFVQKSCLSNVSEIETSCTAFIYLQFFCTFLQKENSAKAALQMLVKLRREVSNPCETQVWHLAGNNQFSTSSDQFINQNCNL